MAIILIAMGCGPKGSPGQVSGSFSSLQGDPIELSEFRGKVVFLHFFTTSSLAAIADVARLRPLVDTEQTAVLGITVDSDKQEVTDWVVVNEVTYPVLLATKDSFPRELFGGFVAPSTVILDKSGRLHKRVQGQLDPSEINKALKQTGANE